MVERQPDVSAAAGGSRGGEIPPRSRARELRVAIATVILFVIFDRIAAWLGSTRGEAGLGVCAVVLALVVGVERLLTGAAWASLPARLGLAAPTARAVALAGVLSAALLGFLPLFAVLTGAALVVRGDAPLLALGIFAQGGIAEETLFRGFLFRHFRERRAFWPAAGRAAVPFVAAHLLLFATLDITVALAALLVSLSLTFPLARLFDLAGGSIWPGALLHAVVQGAIKLVEPASGDAAPLALGWMATSALLPWVVFAFPVARRPSPSS